MKTLLSPLRLVTTTVCLGLLVTFAHSQDDPGVEHWGRGKRIETFSAAKKVTPTDLVTLRCKKCKASVSMNGNLNALPGENVASWFVIGARKACAECEGEITIAQGKGEDDMVLDCSKCGPDSVKCLVAGSTDQ